MHQLWELPVKGWLKGSSLDSRSWPLQMDNVVVRTRLAGHVAEFIDERDWFDWAVSCSSAHSVLLFLILPSESQRAAFYSRVWRDGRCKVRPLVALEYTRELPVAIKRERDRIGREGDPHVFTVKFVLKPGDALRRLFCPVLSCPCADPSRSPGWASLLALSEHVDSHLSGALQGAVPEAWFMEFDRALCRVCGLLVSNRSGLHRVCSRPDSNSAVNVSVL